MHRFGILTNIFEIYYYLVIVKFFIKQQEV